MTATTDTAPGGAGSYGRAGDRVTAALREMIANGQLSPGEHLRQDELAARLSSTRVPVREAFKALAAEGVLSHRPNYGYHVAKLTSTELAQLCWLRDTCENQLARTVRWPSPDTADDLRRRNEGMRELIGAAAHAIVEADRRFHEGLWTLSPQRLVVGEAARMWTLITPYRSLMDYGDEVVTRMYGEHAGIVAALETRDHHAYELCVAAHQRHIYDVVGELAERESASG